jgi:4-hydroxy-tetrahydrodipicolinate synthase
MNARPPLAGLFVPLVTPFDERGRVDLDCVQRLAAQLLELGAAGLAALATTGEASSLDESERDAVIKACAAVCLEHKAPLLVGAGTNDTRVTIERHEELRRYAGVTHSLAVVPYYVRPSESAIIAHFAAVAARSPVPLVVYNIPYRTGRGLGAASILEVARIENIVGVKQAVGGIDADTLTVLADAPDGFAVLAGDDPYILPVILMGGAGGIAASAHICTELFATLIRRGLTGDVEVARALAESLLPLTVALFAEPSPAVIKALLHDDGRIGTPNVRMPLANASPAALEEARAARDRALRLSDRWPRVTVLEPEQ